VNTITSPSSFSFLQGGGDMGALTRTFDWSQTAIGTPDQWPQSLCTSVSILLNSQFPMFVWWGKELTTIYNNAYKIIAGDKHPDLLGRSGREGWSEIWDDLAPLVDNVFKGNSTWAEDLPLNIKRHGFEEETYFTFSYSPILDESGDVGGLFCAVIETTEKVVSKKKLEESESRFRNMVTQAPVGTCVMDAETLVVENLNQRFVEIAGKPYEAIMGHCYWEAFAEAAPYYKTPLQEVVDTGKTFHANEAELLLIRHGEPETIYVTFVYEPLKDEDGRVQKVAVWVVENTDQVKARRKIEESEQLLRNVILQAPFATCIFRGKNFVIEVANESMFELWGKTSAAVMHKPLFEAIPEAKDQGYEELMTTVFETGQDFSAKELPVNLPRNGTVQEVFVNFRYRPIREMDGTVSGIIAVAVDVTEQVVARKKIEESEALLQKRVMERTRELANANEELKRSNENLEEFAYAASHDMKEPIRKIHFFSDRLKTSLNGALSEEQLGYFQRMQTAANRMTTLIDDLLLYSHIGRGASLEENIDLNELAALVLEDLDLERDEKKANITIGQLPVVKGHKRQLQQLFQNLIGNSLKYSKPGIKPVISITCSRVSNDVVPASLSNGDGSRAYYLFHFQDNGIGFEQLDAERIFNVFTRLHGNTEYKGTGVGLSIVRKVVENHHGAIVAESTRGDGATFKVFLPV
jgi:PAS domain S-box-containing protein